MPSSGPSFPDGPKSPAPGSINTRLSNMASGLPAARRPRMPSLDGGYWSGALFGGEGRLTVLDLQTGRLLLARPHLGIDAAAGEELAMVAALDDAAGFNDEDLVGVNDGRQAMRDGQGRVPGRHLGEARLDLALGLGVERRGRLVEHEPLRRLQHDPRAR